MSPSEPSENFERVLMAVQHYGGVIMLAFNSFIVLLIIRDDDIRNKHYRKYLCTMQITSLLFDSIFDFYSPIVLIHKGLFYSDSLLATIINVETCVRVESVIMAEIVLSYFACVYYRRCLVMGPEQRFNYRGKQRIRFYIFLQAYVLSAVSGMLYFLHKSVVEAEYLLPADLFWVRNRTSFMYFREDANMQYAAYCSFPATTVLAVGIIGMLSQLVKEVKSVRKTSIATQRYQRLAVRSLVLQGAVPSLVYIIPSCTNTLLQFAPTVVDCGEQFDRFASFLSPIVWLIITKHTFVSSLTILYCSPSYRARIVPAFMRSQNSVGFHPQQLSETSSRNERTY